MSPKFSRTATRRGRMPTPATQRATTKRQPRGSLRWHTSLSSQRGKRIPRHNQDREEKGRNNSPSLRYLSRHLRLSLFWPRQTSYWRTVSTQHWFGKCSNRGSPPRGKAQELWRRSLAASGTMRQIIGKSQATPAIRPKGKSSMSWKAPKPPRTPCLQAPGPAAFPAFALFVLRRLPSW